MLFSLSPPPEPSFDDGVTAGTLLITEHLRDLRMSRGQSREFVSQATHISPSALKRLEDVAGPASEEQVRRLLLHFEEAATDEIEDLVGCLRDRDIVSDWAPGAGKRLAAVERAASHVRTFTSHAVPPIAQTPAYAAAVAELWPAGSHFGVAEADARRLGEGDTRAVQIILEEGLLRRRIGPWTVMEEQWAHFQGLVERRRVEVLVLPLTSEVTLPASHLAELVLHGEGDRYVAVNSSNPEVVTYTTGSNAGTLHEWLTEIQAALLSPEDSFELLGVARKEASAL